MYQFLQTIHFQHKKNNWKIYCFQLHYNHLRSCALAIVLRKSYNYSSPVDCFRSLFRLVLRLNGIYQRLTVKLMRKKKLKFKETKFHPSQINQFTSFCLADVSRNDAFHDSAKRLPSSVDTARSWCRSVLLPTRTTGTL